MPARNLGIDWLRSICILYIVGFWHLLGYAPAIQDYKTDLTHRLTLIVLGLFMLISGHLVGRSSFGGLGLEGRNWHDFVLVFYRRRLARIYPPYVLSLLLFELFDLLKPGQLLGASLLISSLIDDAPLTLWYINVLMVYLALSPFILLLRARLNPAGSQAKDLFILAGLVGVNLLLAVFSKHADPRLFFYFSPFVVGLLNPGVSAEGRRGFFPLLTAVVGGAFLYSVHLSNVSGELTESNLAIMPLAVFGPWFVFLIVNMIELKLRLPWIVAQISLASFFMYLFHRPILAVMTSWVSPQGARLQLAYLLLICLPVIISISWFGQRLYDRSLLLLPVTTSAGKP